MADKTWGRFKKLLRPFFAKRIDIPHFLSLHWAAANDLDFFVISNKWPECSWWSETEKFTLFNSAGKKEIILNCQVLYLAIYFTSLNQKSIKNTDMLSYVVIFVRFRSFCLSIRIIKQNLSCVQFQEIRIGAQKA